MKKTFALFLVFSLIVSIAIAETSFEKYKQYMQSYSVAASEAAQHAHLPEGIELNEYEEYIFRIGYAAGYDGFKHKDKDISSASYILNIKSMIFHEPGCYGEQKIKSENRQETNLTRQELIEQGYKPCGICNP